MKPVVLARQAEVEAREAAAFYGERNPDLEHEFTDELERVLALLQEHPEIGVRIEGDLRRVLLRRFPYRLLYRIEADQVLVLVVAHQHRRPEQDTGRA